MRLPIISFTNPIHTLKRMAQKYGPWSTSGGGGLGRFWRGGYDDSTGATVNAQTSMQVTAAAAAVRVLSRAVAILPLFVYQRTKDGKEILNSVNLHNILHTAPNKYQTPSEWKELQMRSLLLRGNGYSEIIGTDKVAISELISLNPDRVQPFWTSSGEKAFRYQPLRGAQRVILAHEMLHIMGAPDENGLKGIDPIQEARRALGISISTDEYGARFFKNSARPDIVISVDHKLDDDGKNLRETWNNDLQGVEDSHKIKVLSEGASIKELSLSPENSQFIENKKFNVVEIARIFNVPPHMIYSLERSTFNNIESMSIQFVVYSLTYWLVRIEETINKDLIPSSEKENIFTEFMLNALLRGDLKSRYAAYAVGRQWGWLSVNDIRKLENMNTIGAAGDVYLQPLNMIDSAATTTRNEDGTRSVSEEMAQRFFEFMFRNSTIPDAMANDLEGGNDNAD